MKTEKILMYGALAVAAYFVYEKFLKGKLGASNSSTDTSSIF